MLSVILLILKIIGITILVLLGILLFIILIVLFVPIRYWVRVEHGDAINLNAGVSWLLHLVHTRISQTGGERRIWLRIMGILVYDSLRPPKVKKLRHREKTKANTKANTKVNTKANTEANTEADTEAKGIIASKDEIGSEDRKKPLDVKREDIKGSIKDNITQNKVNPKDAVKESIHEEKSIKDEIKNDDFKNNETKHDDIGFIRKLANSFRNIKSKIKGFFLGIKTKIKKLFQKLFSIKDKATLILDFISDDSNKRGFRFTYEVLRKVLKHILPRKLRSRLIFGTGDPCSTGQALGVFAILYSFYGDKIQVTPDFENKVFKGSHYARGRIRSFTLLIIAIKLLFDKRFKDLKMNFQLLKEAL